MDWIELDDPEMTEPETLTAQPEPETKINTTIDSFWRQ